MLSNRQFFCLFVFLIQPKSKGDGSCSHFREYFRLEQLQEEFDVTTENDLRFNRRFQLLLLRDRDVAEFRHSKLVPLYEREIPRDAFTVSIKILFYRIC